MKANIFFLLLGLIALLCSCDNENIPDTTIGTKAWNETDTLPGQGLSITIKLDSTGTEYTETVYFPRN